MKRTHARVQPPKRAFDAALLMEQIDTSDSPTRLPMDQQVGLIVANGTAMAEVEPIRNRAERRALVKALMRRRPDGKPAPRQGAVPGVRR